ncbi:hypothetical protein D3C75_1001420 [compost metagenome]
MIDSGIDRLPGHVVVGKIAFDGPAQYAVTPFGAQAHRTDFGTGQVAVVHRGSVGTGCVDEQAPARPEGCVAVCAAELRRPLGPGHLGLFRLARFQRGDPGFQRSGWRCRRYRCRALPAFDSAQARLQLLDLHGLLLHQLRELGLAQWCRR